MNTQSIEQAISGYLKKLNTDEQRKILEFARALNLSKLKGIHGKELIKFASLINKDDLNLMKDAIETECEKVNENEW